MISELITDHNRVGLPGLGTFVAEVVPATFSDKGYTINPPYRRLSFHPSRSEDTLLIDFYAASNGISKEAAGLYLKQFLGEMKSVLKERKTITLPGLGRLRATVENNFFFVPDPDLDIYPDGFALKPLSLKTISMVDEVEIPIFPPLEEKMEEEMEVKGAAEVEGESAGEAEAREMSENKEETGGPVSPAGIQPERRQSEPQLQAEQLQLESEQSQPETEPQLESEQSQQQPEPAPQSEPEQSQPQPELQLQAEQPQSESEQLQPESEAAPQPEQQPGPGEQEPQPRPEQPQPQSEISQTQPQSESEQSQPQPAPQPQSRPETGPVHAPRRFRWWIPLLVLLAVAAVALLAFLTVAQVAPDFIDSILYTPEELRIINY